jgi:hypothetical protein
LLIAAAGVPVSLLWDFSWESTIGIDRFWAPPHALTYAAIVLAGAGAMALLSVRNGLTPRPYALRLGRFEGPLGGWLVMWGALAFGTAVVFDRWWQSAYGLGAGIWHPPQILKAIAFFAVVGGVWLLSVSAQNESGAGNGAVTPGPITGGLILAMIHVVTLTLSYPNQQHSASFYKIACVTYPIVLAALARAGRWHWSATAGAMVYMAVVSAAVWLLPLVPGRPEVGPIYNSLTHLMPPPFPLLLIVPALAMDGLMHRVRWPAWRGVSWLQMAVLGVAFFITFLFTQWIFAEFLLTPAADNRFFAGGGRHWPFFLKINPPARVGFWEGPDQMNGNNVLVALGLSLIAVRLGLWLGGAMARMRR